LGRGCAAQVFLARYEGDDVAIKVLELDELTLSLVRGRLSLAAEKS